MLLQHIYWSDDITHPISLNVIDVNVKDSKPYIVMKHWLPITSTSGEW